LKAGEDALRVGHYGKDAEEVVGEHVAFEVADAGRWNGVPEPTAVEVAAM
jgi:hypothetical protein